MNPVYQDVRQWLSAQRQANGGQLACLSGASNVQWGILAGVTLAAMAVCAHRRHPTAAIVAGSAALLLLMGGSQR